jgi:hypothetical protein
VLIFSFVPNASCKHFQNLEVKREYLSYTIEAGTPCNLTMSLMYISVSLGTESVMQNGMK